MHRSYRFANIQEFFVQSSLKILCPANHRIIILAELVLSFPLSLPKRQQYSEVCLLADDRLLCISAMVCFLLVYFASHFTIYTIQFKQINTFCDNWKAFGTVNSVPV